MDMPSPFQVGAAVGSNISGGIRQARDTSALDSILTQFANNPEQQDMAIQQILRNVSEERRPMAMQMLQQKQQQFAQQKQQAAKVKAVEDLGLDPSYASLDNDILKTVIASRVKGGLSEKAQAKQNQLVSGLNSVNRIKQLIDKGHIGFTLDPQSQVGEYARDRAEMATLGRSLIPIASAGVSIRNQKEFEEYKKVITDPNARVEKIQGAIAGLERIINDQLNDIEPRKSPQGRGDSPDSNQKDKPSLEDIFNG